jgi:copper chaperone CopZ
MAAVTITVAEIHCAGCENTIRAALSRVQGVRSVQPDHRTNQVKIAYDEARTGETSVRETLAGLGFDPVAS